MPVIDVHVAAGTFVDRVGEQTGSALHRFALEEAAAAHGAVEGGAVGKVLIAVGTI